MKRIDDLTADEKIDIGKEIKQFTIINYELMSEEPYLELSNGRIIYIEGVQ